MSQPTPYYELTNADFQTLLFFLDTLNDPEFVEGFLQDFQQSPTTGNWYGNWSTMTQAERDQIEEWVLDVNYVRNDYTESQMAVIMGGL